MTNWNHP